MDKVIHFEVPAADIARAQKFYQQVFGWQIDKFPGEMEYYIIKTVATDKQNIPTEAGAINGGLMEQNDKIKAPVIVISVKSLDDKLKTITAAGGKIITPKMPVAGMGLYAYVADTEGNVIGVWQDLPKS